MTAEEEWRSLMEALVEHSPGWRARILESVRRGDGFEGWMQRFEARFGKLEAVKGLWARVSKECGMDGREALRIAYEASRQAAMKGAGRA